MFKVKVFPALPVNEDLLFCIIQFVLPEIYEFPNTPCLYKIGAVFRLLVSTLYYLKTTGIGKNPLGGGINGDGNVMRIRGI